MPPALDILSRPAFARLWPALMAAGGVLSMAAWFRLVVLGDTPRFDWSLLLAGFVCVQFALLLRRRRNRR